jgi:hypothetical protein
MFTIAKSSPLLWVVQVALLSGGWIEQRERLKNGIHGYIHGYIPDFGYSQLELLIEYWRSP